MRKLWSWGRHYKNKKKTRRRRRRQGRSRNGRIHNAWWIVKKKMMNNNRKEEEKENNRVIQRGNDDTRRLQKERTLLEKTNEKSMNSDDDHERFRLNCMRVNYGWCKYETIVIIIIQWWTSVSDTRCKHTLIAIVMMLPCIWVFKLAHDRRLMVGHDKCDI